MEKIAKDNEAIGHRVKSIEGKQCEFDDSLAAMQRELDDYKKTTLQQRQVDSARPRAIVIRLLRFSDTVKIIEAAGTKFHYNMATRP